jgi:hypothetical protein
LLSEPVADCSCRSVPWRWNISMYGNRGTMKRDKGRLTAETTGSDSTMLHRH